MTNPTPLEAALLETFYALYKELGFPKPDEVKVRDRKATGSGRYTNVYAPQATQLDDGYLDLGGRFVVMPGVPNGIMVVARIKDKQLQQIELSVYGNDS